MVTYGEFDSRAAVEMMDMAIRAPAFIYKATCYYDAKRKRVRWRATARNMITTVGANKILDACFKTGLASPAWFIGMIAGASPGTFATTDTISSHPGWTEISSGLVVETARVVWTPGTISAGSVDNTASPALYHMNGSATLQGLFVIDDNTLDGTSLGTLYSEANFAEGPQVVSTGNVISITATLIAVAG